MFTDSREGWLQTHANETSFISFFFFFNLSTMKMEPRGHNSHVLCTEIVIITQCIHVIHVNKEYNCLFLIQI